MLIRHSQRSNKKACNKCHRGGEKDSALSLYWYHDDATNGGNTCSTATCKGYGKDYRWILFEDPNGTKVHPCHASRLVTTPVTTVLTPEAVKNPPAPSLPEGDLTGELARILAELVGKQTVDRDEVITIVRDTLDVSVADYQARIDAYVAATVQPAPVKVEVTFREQVREVDGAHPLLPEVLTWLAAGRIPYLIGPAGCGKTTLAMQAADALGLTFYTDGMLTSEHQVLGFVDAGGNYHTTPCRQVTQCGGLYLGDELDGWDENAALALHSVTGNGHMTFPDSPVPLTKHADALYVFAGNTWGHGADREYVGRNPLDFATLSRLIALPMDYDTAIETKIAGDHTDLLALLWKVRANVRKLGMRHIVGTRELAHAVAGLDAGLDEDRVISVVIRRNLNDSDWAKVTA